MAGLAWRLGRKYLGLMGPSVSDAARAIYAAAKTNLATGSWTVADHRIGDLTAADAGTIRARVRELVRDMPHAARAVQVLTDLTVGTGIQVQPRVLDDAGAPIRELNRRIEEAWKRWQDEADAGGRMHFGELQALAKRCEIETGEAFFLKRESAASGRLLPFALQPVEPEMIASHWVRQPGLDGKEIDQGIEYDPYTLRPAAYYLVQDVRGLQTKRVLADSIIHIFHSLRPGQLRGISPLAAAVVLSHSLRDYIGAEMEAAQKAARWLAFVTTPNPAGAMTAFGAALDSDHTDSTGNHAKYVMEMGNAVVDFLQSGEEVKIADHNRPGDSFTPFTRWALQTFAAVAGISYELISGNYEGLNYSVLRGIRNDLIKGIDVHQARMIRQFCQPVYREFLRWAVMAGELSIPNFFSDRWRYERALWTGPGMSPVDPLKEGRADADAVKSRLKSPIEAIRSRGKDPDDVLDEIAEFEAMLEDRGLDVEPVSAATATNPASLESSEAEGPDRRVRRVK